MAEEETKNPVTDNSDVSNGNPGTEKPESTLGNILEGMTDKQPETEPGNDTDGKNDEGSGKQDEKDNAKDESNDGDKLPAWTSQLSDELKNNADVMKQLGKFTKISELAKSYAELEKTLGDRVKLPGKETSEAEQNSFYEKLGKPKAKEDYSFIKKDTINFAETAFKNNLTKTQAENIFNMLEESGQSFINAQKAQATKMFAETDKMLHETYGNKYSEKVELMKRGIEAYGGKDLGTALNSAGVLYHPAVVNMFIALGEQTAEAGSVTKGTQGIENYKSTNDGGSFKFKI